MFKTFNARIVGDNSTLRKSVVVDPAAFVGWFWNQAGDRFIASFKDVPFAVDFEKEEAAKLFDSK